MKELLSFEILSWLQFVIIAIVVGFAYLILRRFHLFSDHVKERSIGYRMFIYVLLLTLTVSFLLIRPIFHALILLVVFGLFSKNIVSYSRALFSLYFSNVKFGDNVQIGDVVGNLESMNFGGVHVITDNNKVFFPFNMWNEDKLILVSEAGKVHFAFACTDATERKESQALHDLEKGLFNYPYLETSNVTIEKDMDTYKVSGRLSDGKCRVGLLKHIAKAGFHLKGNKK